MACLKAKLTKCGVCSLRVMADSVLCGRWILGRFIGVKRVTSKFYRNFACRKYEGNIGEAVEREESYLIKWKQSDSLHILVTG